MIWVVLAVLLVAAVGAKLVGDRRRRREPGMQSFRRHLDALSPEARREVADRVRRSLDEHPDGRDR